MNRRERPWLLGMLAAVVFLFSTGAAWAQGSKLDEAKRTFAAGDQAYAAGQYLAAARAYENAYALHPLPEITFSTAQAYRRHYFEDTDITWLEKAKSLYRRYLEEEPKGGRRDHAITHLANIALLLAANQTPTSEDGRPAALTELLIASATPGATASIDGAPPRNVPVVQKVTATTHRVKVMAPGFFDTEMDAVALEGRLSIVPIDLKPRPGALRVVATDDADVWIDGRLVGQAPLAKALELSPGDHSVSVTARGRRPVSRSVTIERGKPETVRVELQTSDQRVAAHWSLAGSGFFALVGGAMAILAGVSEVQAEDARAGLAEGRALTPAEAADSNEALARRDLARTLSFASFGVSAAAGVTGTLVFVFDNPVPTAATRDAGTTYGLRFGGAF